MRDESKFNFFEAGSPFLTHPLLTRERTAAEIDFIEAELTLAAGARLLDVGCGFGRHSIELARRGYAVVGIDPAAAMIAAARLCAEETAVSVDFRQVYAEQFVAEKPFDAAICLFTSLGQVSEQGENSGLARRVYDALKPGGQFMVEAPQRGTAVAQLRAADKFGDDERYTAVSRHYDPQTRLVTENFHVVAPGTEQSYRLCYRLYDRSELFALLAKAGFIIQAAYSSYEGTALADEHPTMLVIGQKEQTG